MSTQDDLDQVSGQTSAEASAQASASASIADGVETSAEVEANFNYYKSYAPKRSYPKNLSGAASWGKDALVKYAKDNAKHWGAEAIEKVASAYGYEGYVPSEIPTNEKEAADALVNIACAAAAEELGVDPRLAKVTVEAVMDGKLDKNDAESIGSVAGSIAGAALCQAYGIPAPIGAFLGGEIGGFIGGEIADIFGASKRAHEEWLRKQRAIVARARAEAEEQCRVIREGYWTNFDAYVNAAELRWEELELKAGGLFGIRWFGRTPSYGFMQFVDQQLKNYGNRVGPQSCDVVCFGGERVYHSGAPYVTSLTNRTDEQLRLWNQCRDGAIARIIKSHPKITRAMAESLTAKMPPPVDDCGKACLADYGCPYPDMTPFVGAPSVPGALASAKRVTSGYYALGFHWLPPQPYAEVPAAVAAKLGPFRQTYCRLPAATKREVESMKYRKLWTDWLTNLVNAEITRIQNLNRASVRLFGDLAQTAAMVAVQNQIADSKTRAQLRGLGELDPAITRASSWVNNGALVAGLGWLAINSRRG